jgi:hypothetical protein
VNICQQNLMLAAAPPGENAAHIALFQAVGGLSAGLSGIAGGWLLDRLTAVHFSVTCGPFQCGPFAVLFLLSGIGRALAIAWLPPLGASRGRRPRPLRT